MIDPTLLHKLTHAHPTAAELLSQLSRLDPDLAALPAALPLLASRLMGAAAGVEEPEVDDEDDQLATA